MYIYKATKQSSNQATKQTKIMSNTMWIPSFEEIKVVTHENGDVCMDGSVTYRNLEVNTEWFRDAVMGDVAEQVFGDGNTHAIFYNKEKDMFKVVFDSEQSVTISKPFFDKFMMEELEEYPGIQEDKNPKDIEGYTLIYKKN